MKTRTFKIIDIDAETIVEVDTRKHLLELLDEMIEMLQVAASGSGSGWFDFSEQCFSILYEDGTEDVIDEEYDGHKIRRTHIVSIVYDDSATNIVYGNFEMNEYGVVTTAFDEKIDDTNIWEIL